MLPADPMIKKEAPEGASAPESTQPGNPTRRSNQKTIFIIFLS